MVTSVWDAVTDRTSPQSLLLAWTRTSLQQTCGEQCTGRREWKDACPLLQSLLSARCARNKWELSWTRARGGWARAWTIPSFTTRLSFHTSSRIQALVKNVGGRQSLGIGLWRVSTSRSPAVMAGNVSLTLRGHTSLSHKYCNCTNEPLHFHEWSILATSLMHFSLKGWEIVLFELKDQVETY